MVPESEWVWYGFAGHLIVSNRCVFHLCTRVGEYLVSTVGAFYPDRDGRMETVSTMIPDAYYETMVFLCDGDDKHGNPIHSGEEIEVFFYPDSLNARKGHRRVCMMYA